jgi:hypothetical protein
VNEQDRITDLADRLSLGVRKRRLQRGGYSQTEIDTPPVAFEGLPEAEQQTWRDTAETVLELFGVQGGPGEVLVQDDQDALAALDAVLAWARSKPDHVAEGGNTGISFQRGPVIATDVLPERTIGVSTYRTPIEAAKKLDGIERGYEQWLRSIGATPRDATEPRRAERALGIHEDFGGLVAGWLTPEHSFVAHVAHGRITEVMRLTPLNTLQLRANVDELIRRGKAEGYITEEHVRESLELPPMPAAEYHPDYAPKD